MAALIRPILEQDDSPVGVIIRSVLTEYGANRPGFAWQDPELDQMSRAYNKLDCLYLVAEMEGTVLGGAGIGPFDCVYENTCELQKMYLIPEARGKGIGKRLIEELEVWAINAGYKKCYLETLESMSEAGRLYRRSGFKKLAFPLGKSGHSGCDNWYMKDFYKRAEDKLDSVNTLRN